MKNTNIPSFLFLVIFLFFSPTILAQKKQIDSLKSELEIHEKRDTIRVNLLNVLAQTYRSNDISKAEEFANEANDLSRELNFEKGIAMSALIFSKIHISKSQFDEAKEDALIALKLYKKSKDSEPKDFIAVYNTLGMVSNYRNNFEKALEYFEKANDIAIENKNLIRESDMLSNIGITFFKKGDLDEASVYFKKSIAITDKLGVPKRSLPSLNNLAIIFSIQGKYAEALELYNKVLVSHRADNNKKRIGLTTQNMGILYSKMEQYEKAYTYFEEALQIHKELENQLNIALSLNSLGSTLIELKDYEKGLVYLKDGLALNKKLKNIEALVASHIAVGKVRILLKKPKLALDHFKSALKLSESVEDKRNMGSAHINLAEVYIILKNYPKALDHANKGKLLVDKLDMLAGQVQVNRGLADIYAATGNYKNALTSHQQFKLLNDSLFNKKNVEKFAQLEAEYKYKQQLDFASIRELKLTKTVKSTSQDLEKSQRNYLWAIITFLLISMVLGGVIFYLKFRNIKAKTHSIIVEQKLLRSQMTPHFIFNSLSVLQGMILNKEEKKSVVYLSKFSKLLRIILENSRDKVVPLSQELEAVENYLSLQNLENESYSYTISVEDTIDTSSFEIPPMLIQPFVENAVEHAFTNEIENKQIDVDLFYKDQKLVCTIVDNGIGINSQRISKRKDKTSLATIITSERLKILSKDFNREGSVTIEDRENHHVQGTKVVLVIPYKTLNV